MDDDGADRRAILERRRRFVALALAGLTGTAPACAGAAPVEPRRPEDDPGTGEVAPVAATTDAGIPQPCLSVEQPTWPIIVAATVAAVVATGVIVTVAVTRDPK
jgi:hypothetical protein